MKTVKLLSLLTLMMCFLLSNDLVAAQKRKSPVKKQPQQEQVEESEDADKQEVAKKKPSPVKKKAPAKKKKSKKKKSKGKKKGASKTPVRPVPQRPAPKPAPKPAPVATPAPAPESAPVVEESTPIQTLSADESMPQFPEGEEAMYAFITNNLQYPEAAKQNGINGRVIVRFFVDRKGELSNIKVEQSLSAECDAEAVRIVKSMPAWHPAKQNGLPVAVSIAIPIVFTLH
ncbi:MAG: energy transducer TonB [Prevotellaceae bacterium]|jgi:protein TonB|nr:energy transducer TonB [Prevotellaceae bacterium]